MAKRKLTQEELVEVYYKNKSMKKAIARVRAKQINPQLMAQEKRERERIERVERKKKLFPMYEEYQTQKSQPKPKPKTKLPEYHYENGTLVLGRKTAVLKKGAMILQPEKLTSKRYVTEQKIKKGKVVTSQRLQTKEEILKDIGRKVEHPYIERVKRLKEEFAPTKERFKKAFKRREGKKSIKEREKAIRGTLTAMGIIQGKQTYGGAGRPRGSYIHGMPIHIYKKMLRDKKALYQRYQDEQNIKMRARGFTPEQIQQIQQQQAVQELQQPIQEQGQEMPQEYQGQQMPSQMPQQPQMPNQILTQMPQVKQKLPYGRILPRSQYPVPPPSVADEELRFRQWSAEKTISPRTQMILDRLRRTQNLAKTHNIEHQRRIRERSIVGMAQNMFRAHENMIDTTMDFTNVDMNENILGAPNIFKVDRNRNNSILRTDRPNILQTKETGNNLFF